jgi:hypothetical protein
LKRSIPLVVTTAISVNVNAKNVSVTVKLNIKENVLKL